MVDYSVWDHIEVSDDEDETHPNIDTASLFRWRHQVRPFTWWPWGMTPHLGSCGCPPASYPMF
uniref:Hsp90 co-chaperone Cdc37 n=2 Tax=Amniota TaxID=32524 RepID=A0A8C9JLN2_PANTA